MALGTRRQRHNKRKGRGSLLREQPTDNAPEFAFFHTVTVFHGKRWKRRERMRGSPCTSVRVEFS